MMTKERYTYQQIIEALESTRGMVYLAAQELGCSHTTVYNYIRRYASVRKAWEHESGKMGDVAEQKLYDAIMTSDMRAITFYLSTKGKDRGYSQRQEITGAGGGPIKQEQVVFMIPQNNRDEKS